MKNLFLMLTMFFITFDMSAATGVLKVKNAQENVYVYNSVRGKGRHTFISRLKEGEQYHRLEIPESDCNDLLFMLVNGRASWIKISPGEELEIDVKNVPWNFAGEQAKINDYLYAWTQEFWLKKTSTLTSRTVTMFHGIPNDKKSIPDAHTLYGEEYLNWMMSWEQASLRQLESYKLSDLDFVSAQKRRIYYCWLEMQLFSYSMSHNEVEIPAKAMAFAKDLEFADASLLDYPGYLEVMDGFVDIAEALGMVNYTSTNFLREQSELFVNQEIKEFYILKELETIILRGNWFYQTDKVLMSVKDLMKSEYAKKKWKEYDVTYKKLVNAPSNHEGKKLVYFEFEDINGNTVKSTDFNGKYLYIDLWATWCGPCKYQIPFLKKLEEEMRGKNIAFLSVSVDRPSDKLKWKKMVNELGLGGCCVISPNAFSNPLCEEYAVEGIPRFMLVGPDGKVIMEKSRRPSDVILKLQLEELLEQ